MGCSTSKVQVEAGDSSSKYAAGSIDDSQQLGVDTEADSLPVAQQGANGLTDISQVRTSLQPANACSMMMLLFSVFVPGCRAAQPHYG